MSLINDSVFWLSFSTLVFTFLMYSIKYAFFSKCSQVKCCCIECIRNVDVEENIRHDEMEHGIDVSQERKN